jgi:hypothetical protein
VSYDRQIDQMCPHVILQEALFLDDDSMTVRPIRPIATASSVAVRLNGAIDIPSPGVKAPAQVTGSRSGPYTIQVGVNDKVVLRVGVGNDQVVTLPAAKDITAAQIIDTLNKSVQGMFFAASGQRLHMRTMASGLAACVFVSSASTFLSTAGIAINKEYRGRDVLPGWTLVNDPTILSDRPHRSILFDQPLKGYQDFVEINYNTVREECRRCGGVGVEHDWRYGGNGEVVRVRDEALLVQEVQKMIYTRRASNPFHNWIGADLLDVVGQKLTTSGFIQNFIVSDIQQAFRRWQAVKRKQEDEVNQQVSDREFPFALQEVALLPHNQDPTILFVRVTIQNRSTEPVVLERGVRFPVPIDLVEPKAAQGTFRNSLTDYVLVQ